MVGRLACKIYPYKIPLDKAPKQNENPMPTKRKELKIKARPRLLVLSMNIMITPVIKSRAPCPQESTKTMNIPSCPAIIGKTMV